MQKIIQPWRDIAPRRKLVTDVTELTFPISTLDEFPNSLSVSLKNLGYEPVTIKRISVPLGFQVVHTGNFPVLNRNDALKLEVRFRPEIRDNYEGNLVISFSCCNNKEVFIPLLAPMHEYLMYDGTWQFDGKYAFSGYKKEV